MEPLLGRGLVTSDGEEWLRQRRATQPSFQRERVAAFGASITRAARDRLDRWRPGEPIEIVAEMMRLALTILGDTLFGADLRADADALHDAVTQILLRVNQQTRTMLYFLPSWLPTPGNLAFRRAVRAFDAIVDRLIREARPDSLIGSLRHSSDVGPLRDQVKSFLFAGHETTAIALAWTLHQLSKYPAEAQRVRRELDEVLGGRAAGCDDLPHLGHLQRFIQETLRIYPPVWFLGRNAFGADELLRLPAGGLVMPTPYVTHHRPDVWENPEGFHPDRFLTEPPPFAYLPFGGGPRQCIGSGFAMMELMLVTACVVQRFDVQLVPGQAVHIDAGITLRPRGGLHVHIRKLL
jgi:cytochrome P450